MCQLKRHVLTCRGYFVLEARKMVVEWYKLPLADPVECWMLVNNLLKDDSFLRQTVDHEGGLWTSWFTVEEIVKLVHTYFFINERSLNCKQYMQKVLQPSALAHGPSH